MDELRSTRLNFPPLNPPPSRRWSVLQKKGHCLLGACPLFFAPLNIKGSSAGINAAFPGYSRGIHKMRIAGCFGFEYQGFSTSPWQPLCPPSRGYAQPTVFYGALLCSSILLFSFYFLPPLEHVAFNLLDFCECC